MPRPTLKQASVWAGRRRRFYDRALHDDRATGADHLILVLTGHKPQLWPTTLARIRLALPAQADVCLVTPGVVREDLREQAHREGWSYLSTRGGHVSVAQNIAIERHPHAAAISKIDEDIFVTPGFFDALRAGHDRIASEAEYDLGFAAPTVNVNGFSYVDYLRFLGHDETYRERFGSLKRAAFGIPAQADGEAAVALWQWGIPVAEIAARFAARPWSYSIVPHRYSIGAIHLRRDVWSEMNGFYRGRGGAPGLGADEAYLCEHCIRTSRAMTVIDNLYAGHFAFGPQTPAMLEAFGDRVSDL